MNLEEFYGEYKKFKVKQNEQKARGLNNFNIFTSVLPITNEVHLHSGFIYSLLNPNGTHYQGTLFLGLFLKEVGLADFINIQLASVEKEYKFIDLYITDGNNHIIIENKLDAIDQDKQIASYIEVIEKEVKEQSQNDKDQSSENILDRVAVIYLSLDRDRPSDNSITGYTLHDDVLIGEDETRRVKFNAIKYKNEIQEWLQNSLQEVSNLTNLNFAISQYIEVIEKLYGKQKGKLMTLDEFIANDPGKWKMAREIGKNYDGMLIGAIEAIAQKELLVFFKGRIDDSSKLESVELCKKNGKMYTSNVYINFKLQNQVIIQLEYDLRMTLCYMTVQFYSFKQAGNTDKSIPHDERFRVQLNNFRGMDIIDFICNNDAIQTWVDGHESCLSKFNDLVNTYKDI